MLFSNIVITDWCAWICVNLVRLSIGIPQSSSVEIRKHDGVFVVFWQQRAAQPPVFAGPELPDPNVKIPRRDAATAQPQHTAAAEERLAGEGSEHRLDDECRLRAEAAA